MSKLKTEPSLSKPPDTAFCPAAQVAVNAPWSPAVPDVVNEKVVVCTDTAAVPAAPAGPAGPVGPTGPAAPVAPLAPVSPFGPSTGPAFVHALPVQTYRSPATR